MNLLYVPSRFEALHSQCKNLSIFKGFMLGLEKIAAGETSLELLIEYYSEIHDRLYDVRYPIFAREITDKLIKKYGKNSEVWIVVRNYHRYIMNAFGQSVYDPYRESIRFNVIYGEIEEVEREYQERVKNYLRNHRLFFEALYARGDFELFERYERNFHDPSGLDYSLANLELNDFNRDFVLRFFAHPTYLEKYAPFLHSIIDDAIRRDDVEIFHLARKYYKFSTFHSLAYGRACLSTTLKIARWFNRNHPEIVNHGMAITFIINGGKIVNLLAYIYLLEEIASESEDYKQGSLCDCQTCEGYSESVDDVCTEKNEHGTSIVTINPVCHFSWYQIMVHAMHRGGRSEEKFFYYALERVRSRLTPSSILAALTHPSILMGAHPDWSITAKCMNVLLDIAPNIIDNILHNIFETKCSISSCYTFIKYAYRHNIPIDIGYYYNIIVSGRYVMCGNMQRLFVSCGVIPNPSTNGEKF